MNLKKLSTKIFVIIFVAIIATPLILFALRIKIEPQKNTDKKISLNFRRNFPLRDDLIKANYKLRSQLLGSIVDKEKVIEGIDGWKFIGDSYNNAFSESKGFLVFSDKQLKKLKASLLNKKTFFESQGITYYIAVAPNKLTVYGDKLPINKYDENTKFHQFKNLCDSLNINFINLGEQFPKPPKEQLYFKTDTHWNFYGGLYGYQEISKHLNRDFPNQNIKNYTLNDLKEITSKNLIGDLNDILLIDKYETITYLGIKNPVEIRELDKIIPVPENYTFDHSKYELRHETDVNNLKIMVLNDSFFGYIRDYFTNSFGSSLYLWEHTYRKELIKKEKPDIFLHEILEREIDQFLKFED
jgi:alginate O-acetyltransferase complex protein AlgJ